MSGFITVAAFTQGVALSYAFGHNYEILQPARYRATMPMAAGRRSDVIWPRSRMMGADYTNIAPIWNNMETPWRWTARPRGVHVRKKIIGVTKDSSGNVVSGVTVSLFNSSTGLLVDSTVSDSVGNYQLGDPNAVSCFVVGDISGAPERAGTTAQNLTGV